jgi:hypothetical protein
LLFTVDLLNISVANKPEGVSVPLISSSQGPASNSTAPEAVAVPVAAAPPQAASSASSASSDVTVLAGSVSAVLDGSGSQGGTVQTSQQPEPAAGISFFNLVFLLIPIALYYYLMRTQYSSYSSAVFVISAGFFARRTFKMHIGQPTRKHVSRSTASLASGRTLVRFPVDLNKLIKYLELKRQEFNVEITMTHIAIKATALAINDFRSLKGRCVHVLPQLFVVRIFYDSWLCNIQVG